MVASHPNESSQSAAIDLGGRSFLKDADLRSDEFLFLIGLAQSLRSSKRDLRHHHLLEGCNIALIFEKPSTRTRCSFEVAAYQCGAHVTYLNPNDSHLGSKESLADTARFLGRLFDGIEYRGSAQESVEILGRYAGVPVWNGLTDQWHPVQMLGDVLTMCDHAGKSLSDVKLCYLGDARNNVANSLLVTTSLLGIDFRIAAPKSLWPSSEVQAIAANLRGGSRPNATITEDLNLATAQADFIYTDVWVSMGEGEDMWRERMDLLHPYRVTQEVMSSSNNPSVKFMHCLPAIHDLESAIGRTIGEQYGVVGLEVSDEVFKAEYSIVFDQAENRLHTTKALLVATIGLAEARAA